MLTNVDIWLTYGQFGGVPVTGATPQNIGKTESLASLPGISHDFFGHLP